MAEPVKFLTGLYLGNETSFNSDGKYIQNSARLGADVIDFSSIGKANVKYILNSTPAIGTKVGSTTSQIRLTTSTKSLDMFNVGDVKFKGNINNWTIANLGKKATFSNSLRPTLTADLTHGVSLYSCPKLNYSFETKKFEYGGAMAGLKEDFKKGLLKNVSLYAEAHASKDVGKVGYSGISYIGGFTVKIP